MERVGCLESLHCSLAGDASRMEVVRSRSLEGVGRGVSLELGREKDYKRL